jgi:HEAT repeat protein
MAKESYPSNIPFQQVLDQLLDTEKPFPPQSLYRFSDLDKNDLARLSKVWPSLPAWRRKALMEDIEALGEDNTLLSFDAIGQFAVSDSDPEVRLPAIRVLWEYENPALVRIFLDLLDENQNEAVRTAAANGLGKFIYLGELEEIPEKLQRQIEDRLLDIMSSDDLAAVRRSALESLGYSTRDEVPKLIEDAFKSGDKNWKASALFAMGRSSNIAWKPQVLAMLDSPIPILRAEAARAVGELEIAAASPLLLELLDDPDDQTRQASIWSLSQLGGEGVREVLERLWEETEDEEESEYIEMALDNLTFNEDMQLLPILDIDEMPANPSEKFDPGYEPYFAETYDEDFGDDDDEDFDEEIEEESEWYEDEEEGKDEDLGD